MQIAFPVEGNSGMKSGILAAFNSPSNLFQVVSGNGNSA
jgi:hypothetical protein